MSPISQADPSHDQMFDSFQDIFLWFYADFVHMMFCIRLFFLDSLGYYYKALLSNMYTTIYIILYAMFFLLFFKKYESDIHVRGGQILSDMFYILLT